MRRKRVDTGLGLKGCHLQARQQCEQHIPQGVAFVWIACGMKPGAEFFWRVHIKWCFERTSDLEVHFAIWIADRWRCVDGSQPRVVIQTPDQRGQSMQPFDLVLA